MAQNRLDFIVEFIRRERYKKMVEVGTYKADFASAVYKKVQLDELHLIDIAPMGYALQFPNDQPNVKLHIMPSIEAAKLFPDEYFDVVYQDASHEYQDVLDDFHAWWPKLGVGGLYMGDDYVYSWPGVEKAVTELLPEIGRTNCSFMEDKSRMVGQFPNLVACTQWYLVK